MSLRFQIPNRRSFGAVEILFVLFRFAFFGVIKKERIKIKTADRALAPLSHQSRSPSGAEGEVEKETRKLDS